MCASRWQRRRVQIVREPELGLCSTRSETLVCGNGLGAHLEHFVGGDVVQQLVLGLGDVDPPPW